MEFERILGVKVNITTKEKIIDLIKTAIVNKSQIKIVAINPEKIILSKNDINLRDYLEITDVNIPDGIGVVIYSILNNGLIHHRITGIDLMLRICKESKILQGKYYLFGSKLDVVESAIQNLMKMNPSFNCVGYNSGYDYETDKIVSEINESKSNILFVGLGSPKQELWIKNNYKKLKVNVIMGVGGSFDVISGKLRRAPHSFRKHGLEWFYRFLLQPWRTKKLVSLITYVYYMFVELFNRR